MKSEMELRKGGEDAVMTWAEFEAAEFHPLEEDDSKYMPWWLPALILLGTASLGFVPALARWLAQAKF